MELLNIIGGKLSGFLPGIFISDIDK